MAKQLKLEFPASCRKQEPASTAKSAPVIRRNIKKPTALNSTPTLAGSDGVDLNYNSGAFDNAQKSSEKNSLILESIFRSLISEFFASRTDLLDYRLDWSNRPQKRTLASCNLRARKILVAQELNHPDYQKYLPALIYHELCHAVLGYSVRSSSGRSSWHGREFRALERKHPEIIQLNLWIKEGGWKHAVRRHRGKIAAAKRLKTIANRQRTAATRVVRKHSIEVQLISQTENIFSRFIKSIFKK